MRITEQSNPITETMDRATPSEFISMVASAEAQCFGSPIWGDGLSDPTFLANLTVFWTRIRQALSQGAHLVMAGAGTSGRLALQIAACYQGPGRVTGLLAGGIDAFFKAKEGVEDSPQIGQRDLEAIVQNDEPLVYIGITCGLSAAYVAGQLAYALKRPNTLVGLLGFNPPEMALDRNLPDLNLSMKDIVYTMHRSNHAYLLCPVIGPEPVMGSTRMKGGSATKMILETLLSPLQPEASLEIFEQLQKKAFQYANAALPAIEAAKSALRHNARICYIAEPEEGMLALLDASECPPTFGASTEQVSCFVQAGVTRLLPGFPMEGHYINDLRRNPKVGDALIFVTYHEADPELLQAIGRRREITILGIAGNLQAFIHHQPKPIQRTCKDMVLKWWLNLVSTAAFVGYGKIWRNRMIDLRISNLKLWERAIRIIAELGKTDEIQAETALKKVIPGAEDPELDNPSRIVLAIKESRVIPKAILYCRKGLLGKKAMDHLERYPKLTEALAQLEDP